MRCELCFFSNICKYRKEVESILKQNDNPYYIRNNQNQITPVRQVLVCDYFRTDDLT